MRAKTTSYREFLTFISQVVLNKRATRALGFPNGNKSAHWKLRFAFQDGRLTPLNTAGRHERQERRLHLTERKITIMSRKRNPPRLFLSFAWFLVAKLIGGSSLSELGTSNPFFYSRHRNVRTHCCSCYGWSDPKKKDVTRWQVKWSCARTHTRTHKIF